MKKLSTIASLFRDAPIIIDVASSFVCEDTAQPVIECKCGRDHFTDATLRARRDPTRTLDLRRKFIRDLERRWRKISRLATDAVATQDMFGLTSANARSLQIIAMSSGRVNAFQQWIDAALADTILGMDRELWIGGYIREAYIRGWNVAQSQIGRALPLNIDRADIVTKLTVAELQGVIEAFSQRAVRAFSDGLLSHLPPATIARALRQAVDKVGIVRSRMTAQTMVVRANGEAALDAFQIAGHTHVQVLPETVPSPGRAHAIRDAAKKATRARRRGISSGLVEVLTAGDDDVCIICEDIAALNPYTIAEARGLIPAHPNCRCAFVPAEDQRFAHGDRVYGFDGLSSIEAIPIALLDGFDPDEPRNERGEWIAGGIPSNAEKIRNAEIMFGTGSPQHKAAIKKFGTKDGEFVTLTHAYRSVRGGELKVGQIFRDPNEAKLARDVSSLDAGEGSQVWEVDVTDLDMATADGEVVYLPPGTAFEVVGFDPERNVWSIDAQWNEEDHPRDPSGTETGGQFTDVGTPDWGRIKNEVARARAQEALRKWQSDYERINGELRDGENWREGPQSGTITDLTNAVRGAGTKLKEDIVTWRGIGGMGVSSFPAVGEEFIDKGFTSLSTSKRVAIGFTTGLEGIERNDKTLLKVTVEKGSRVVQTPGGAHGQVEKELLLNHGTRFRVTGVKGRVISLTALKQ